MKKTLIIFFVFFLAFITYGYFKSVPGVEKLGERYPIIEASPIFFDFGEVQYGELAQHTFVVKNSGNEALEIKRLSTSCACTSAEIEKEIINPGEEVNLLVKYDTGLMTGPHGMGDQERIIYIKTNDPVNPQIEVTIKAYVK
ncbi:DUF1573 domain-containing protein [Patescibacteria group bacterium]|nr:DUF1573 domain-containing protein [Patescibacteria group bacterium]